MAPGMAPVEWRTSDSLVAYDVAVADMEATAAAIAAGHSAERVWLLEHPALYTAGTSANSADVIDARFPVHATGRGGQMTYHGPGQRVAYVMLDLKRRGPDVRRFVATLEEWIIRTLAAFNVRGERREDRIGVWVRRPDKGEGYEDKIAAIGIRVKQWVTLHGMALNVEPDLSHFSGIVPCGVNEQKYGVTSLADLGIPVVVGGRRYDIAARIRGSCSEQRPIRRSDGRKTNRLPRPPKDRLPSPRVDQARSHAPKTVRAGRPLSRPRRLGAGRKITLRQNHRADCVPSHASPAPCASASTKAR